MDGTGGAARERTRRRLAELREIPALQSLARQFSSVLNRDAVNVDEVVEAIQRDAALCVRVLRMANSVEVSPGQRIEDLATAVQMLGLQRVRKAARALFTLRDTNRVTEGFDWRHLWVHALGTAALAEELAERLGVAAGEPVYEAALLHDVGKVVLATVAPEEYRAVLTRAWREQGRLEELERAELGVTHREAGAIFGRKSGLGEATLAAIAHHDAPERAKTHRTTVALVAAANYLAKRHGIGFGGARLGEADGEFAALTCWDVMREEGARLPALEEWEDAWYAVAAGVRGELRNLQQVAGLKPVAGRPSLVVEAGRGGKDERRK
jgi:putative nucleotidyltransferase with HDIG domain